MYCRNKKLYLGFYGVHCSMTKKNEIKTVHINNTDIYVQPTVTELFFEAGLHFVAQAGIKFVSLLNRHYHTQLSCWSSQQYNLNVIQ